jgi:hypothetical protein
MLTSFVLLLFAVMPARSQVNTPVKDTALFHIDPMRVSLKANPSPNPHLNDHFKRPNNLNVNYPDFPLTAVEFERRVKETNKPIGLQIADNVVESYFNDFLSGKRKKNRKPAQAPRF